MHRKTSQADEKKENIQQIAAELIDLLQPYRNQLQKEERRLGVSFSCLFGKHSSDGYSDQDREEWKLENQIFSGRKKTYEPIIFILNIIKSYPHSFLGIDHFILLEIFKQQYPEFANQINTILNSLLSENKIGFTLIEAKATTILQAPIAGIEPPLETLILKIHNSFNSIKQLMDLKLRETFVSGKNDSTSSIASLFSHPLFDKEVVKLLFEFNGTPSPKFNKKNDKAELMNECGTKWSSGGPHFWSNHEEFDSSKNSTRANMIYRP